MVRSSMKTIAASLVVVGALGAPTIASAQGYRYGNHDRPSAPADDPGVYDTFNQAMRALGLDPTPPDTDPLPARVLNDPNQSPVIIGVPCGGAGSGWVKLKGFGTGPFQLGWLMPDGSKAQAALGAKFDLSEFHEILKEGAVPLTILERRIDERVQAKLRA